MYDPNDPYFNELQAHGTIDPESVDPDVYERCLPYRFKVENFVNSYMLWDRFRDIPDSRWKKPNILKLDILDARCNTCQFRLNKASGGICSGLMYNKMADKESKDGA